MLPHVIIECLYEGPVVRINEKFGASCNRGKPHLYTTQKYKKFLQRMTTQFIQTKKCFFADSNNDIWPITQTAPLQGCVEVAISEELWKMFDSDSIIKSIFDCIEKSEIILNDRQIADFRVSRSYLTKSETPSVSVIVIAEFMGDEWMQYFKA